MRDLKWIVVHHSASPRITSFSTVEEWHRKPPPKGHGWPTIGYARFIDHTGSIYDGAKRQGVQYHARRYNKNGRGICVAGDNTNPAREWNVSQHEALAQEIMYWSDLFPLARVVGHRELPGAKTLCPGLDLEEWLDDRKIVVATLDWTDARIAEGFGRGA